MLHKGHHYLHFSGWKYKGSEGWYEAFKTTKLRWGRSGVKPRCVNSKDHFLSTIHVSFLPVKINEKFSNAIWNLLLNIKLLSLKLYTLLFTLVFLLWLALHWKRKARNSIPQIPFLLWFWATAANVEPLVWELGGGRWKEAIVAWRQVQADICGHTGSFQAMEAS